MSTTYQICTRCVLDTTAKEISFDKDGICNFCTDFIKRSTKILNESSEEKERQLKAFVEEVKKAGKGKRYNCIVGVSGGADSSWTLVKAVELGLKPLAVHMDNGWNSELAQNNISNLVNKLGVDLYTHVIDWAEYKKLMQAFFDADVIDVELLYDNAMLAVNYRLAAKYGIKYVLSGSNQATEGIYTPKDWNWYKFDKRNIKAIGKRFAGIKPKSFPFFSTVDFFWYEYIRKIKWAAPLDLMEYNKVNAMNFMKEHYDYKLYPYKHYESVFTRFYQGYILPEKFNVDKRKLHYSALIVSGQLERADALEKCKGIAYPSAEALQEDIEYFLKKMSWTPEELKNYLARPEITHSAYPTEKPLWDSFLKLAKLIKSIDNVESKGEIMLNPELKRIFVLLVSSGAGGAEKRFANLLNYLSENPDPEVSIDFYVNLSLAKQIPSFYQATKNDNLRFVYFGFPFQSGKNSRIALLSKRLDQVYLFFLLFYKRLFISYDAAHFINLSALRYHFLVRTSKKIWSCFNSENPEAHLPSQSLELRRLYNQLSHIDCLDENIARVVKSGSTDFDINVTSSPCSFIDYRHTEIQSKEMLLTFSGYFRAYKGVHLIIEALKKCMETCTELKVQFLGKGDLEEVIRNELASFVQSGRVEIGYAKNPIEKLKKSLIFVSLQQKENYPSQSLLEAMACGNAIVATNVGLTNLLVNKHTGILVDYDVEQLSAAIIKLYRHKSMAAGLGENGRLLVMESHTVERFWDYLRTIYLTD